MRTWTLSLLLLAACAQDRLDLVGADADEDGFHTGVDCDDDDADVNPGVTEVAYNGHDDDCDGVLSADDCADDDPLRHPTAVEVCNGLDDDCDSATDEDLGILRYADTD